MKRADIFSAILKERDRQDIRWGGPEHEAWEWFEFIRRQLHRGEEASFKDLPEAQRRLVNIAALAVAALEAWDDD